MESGELAQSLNAFGEQDPPWAILSFPENRGGGWELEEFFATGRADVGARCGAAVLEHSPDTRPGQGLRIVSFASRSSRRSCDDTAEARHRQTGPVLRDHVQHHAACILDRRDYISGRQCVHLHPRHEPSAKHLVAADPQAPEPRARALRLMDARAGLVGFRFTSTLRGVGLASTALRHALRRVMFEVPHRQPEHNPACDELARSDKAIQDALGVTVGAQLDIQAATDERLEALERRLARVEVDPVALARRGTTPS